MKIAHIVSTFPPYQGGMGNVCYNQVRYLAKLGYQVTVFSPGEKRVTQGFKVKKLNSFLNIGNASLIFPDISLLKTFDILHLHFPFIGFGEQLLFLKKTKILKSPLVLQYHMDLIGEKEKKIIFDLYNLVVLPFLTAADKILVSSKDYLLHSKIKKYFLKEKEKFEILPLGVREDKFFPSKKKFKKEKYILFVGALDEAHYFKGVDILIKAFKEVSSSLPQARLIIVGRGSLRERYINLAKKLNIRDKIEFANKVDEQNLPFYYQKADLFVLPSISSSEAFGLVTLEAMASGLPVIVSNLPGPRSLVKNNGFLVEPGNISHLSQKIIQILRNDEMRKAFGFNSRQLILKHYSWSKIVARLSDIYSHLFPSSNL